jgi:Phytanoyl-CoA dioxygenase (PhyH)
MRRETFSSAPPTDAEFTYLMATRGWVRFPGVLDPARIEALRADAARVYRLRRAVQEKNGVAAGMEGAAHHVFGEGSSLDAFINDLPLADTIERHFGGKYILLNFGAALHPPGGKSYTLTPHRDVRAWSKDYPLSLNMLVMLDDFTVENGATLMMSGSQHAERMPSPELFQAWAEPAVGQAGDILLFDSLVVHAAAPNQSHAERRALTLCFGRPFMKPQMDWPRYVSPSVEKALTPVGRQLLGYHARVADSLDAYYQPPERWTFKPDQR